MSSSSLVDYLAEKLYSYSAKIRNDCYQPNVSSFLMSCNNSSQHFEISKMFSDIKENNVFHVDNSDAHDPFIPYLRPFGILKCLNYISVMDKPVYFSNHVENSRFSPHLFDLFSNSYHYKQGHSDSSSVPLSSMLSNPMKESLLREPLKMSQQLNSDYGTKEAYYPSVTKATMSVNTTQPLTKTESKVAEEKCNSIRLNLELVQRKTKEMNKRSKKRRRRQRKNEHLNGNNSTSTSEDDIDNDLPSPVTSSVCVIAKSPDFGCTLSVKHTVQISPCKSLFVKPVESDSDDDSEWETFEVISNASSESSPVKFESSECKFSPAKVASTLMSFIVPELDSCDDDSDWETCEIDNFTENTGFEFTGLFLTNLCMPQSVPFKSDCTSTTASDDDCEEVQQRRALLLKVNKNWNELTEEDYKKPKSITKVTFAPDDDLVEVFSVENYERKGEWEIYVTERERFKKRISELETILSPCLNPEHRSKIFKKIVAPEL